MGRLLARDRILGSVLSAAVVAALVPAVAVPSAADPVAGEARIVSVHGLSEVGGRPVLRHVLLQVQPGDSLVTVASDALRQLGARPVTEHDFQLLGLQWPQFFDNDPKTDFVAQQLNPADDPTDGTRPALLASQQTWSEVQKSRFAFRDAGTTDRGAGFDGVNSVSWTAPWPYRPSVLGLASLTFLVGTGDILDADVELNPDKPWSTNPSGPEPDEVDLQTVLLHENGHVAGLDHSADPAAVMGPALAQGQTKRELTADDVAAITTLYPRRPLAELPAPQGPPTPLGVVARVGDPAPGGGIFSGAFEPYALSDRGVAAFVADFSTDRPLMTGGQGVYLGAGPGELLARSGRPAPGGGFFGLGAPFGIGSNEANDVAFSFVLEPLELPFGVNVGVYRYSGGQRELRPVVVPGVTPAPTGGVFRGAYEQTTVTDAGDVLFAGVVPTSAGTLDGLGLGVFEAAENGDIAPLVVPGDAAPAGSVFDMANMASGNARGDVVFAGHLRGEPCRSAAPGLSLACDGGLYLRTASGRVTELVGLGDPAPGGGTFAATRFPVINTSGQVAFVGDVTPAPGRNRDLGVYLYSAGAITPVAVPGQALPDGGHLRRAFPLTGLTDSGDVAFGATLQSESQFGPDSGVYTWSKGALRLVARTGSPIPGTDGVETLAGLAFPALALNDGGRVLFAGVAVPPLPPPSPPPGDEGEPPPPPPPGEPPPPPAEPVFVGEPVLLLTAPR